MISRRYVSSRIKGAFNIFDRSLKISQKNAAAGNDDYKVTEYLREAVASQLVDRLSLVQRDLSTIVNIGCSNGSLISRLLAQRDESSLSSIKSVIDVDPSKNSLSRAHAEYDRAASIIRENIPAYTTKQLDVELSTVSEDNTISAVLSNLELHWQNDLPTVFKNIYKMLKPDGFILASMLGGDTLYELRTSIQLAEQERLGGMDIHVSPMIRSRDVGSLLQQQSFQLITIDVEDIIVSYPNIWCLMYDLKDMGENNAVINRAQYLGKDVMLAAQAIYQKFYGDEDGSISATFQIMHMIGWKYAEGQSKPLKKGSSTHSLKDALEFTP